MRLLLLSVAAALLPGCAGPPSDPEPAAAAPTAIQVRDAANQDITLEPPPERIVAVGRGVHMVLHLLFMFPDAREALVGLEQRGSGVTTFIGPLAVTEDPWVELGAEPGVEAIAALRPDLVMTKGEVLGDRASALSRVGLPTLHVGLESPARFFEDVAMMGAVLDEPERADEIASFYQARLDRMATTVGAIPTKEKPRVLVAAWHARGGETALKVPAAGWMQTQQVVLAGGEPVWIGETSLSKGWTIVNFEQIAAWDPDLVVLCVSPGQDGAEILARLKSDERWALLRVVQQDGLRLFPSDLYDWNSPDPRWILGSSWMAQTLHPERFADLDLRAEVLAFYGELFGLSAERVEAWILPEVGLGDA